MIKPAGVNISVFKADKHSIDPKTGEYIEGQDKLENWTDIIAISAGNSYCLGLKKDGTVVAVGNNTYNQCDVDNWTDIIALSAGGSHSLGLKSDGTVLTTNQQADVEKWENIVSISAGNSYSLGLQSDGNVIAAGKGNYYGQCNVSDWDLW